MSKDILVAKSLFEMLIPSTSNGKPYARVYLADGCVYSSHFPAIEVNSQGMTPPPVKLFPNAIIQLLCLELIREKTGFPLILSSFYRTEEHNKNEGGAADSDHLYAAAADIQRSSGSEKDAILAAIYSDSFLRGRIMGKGVYKWGLHIGTNKYSRVWTG